MKKSKLTGGVEWVLFSHDGILNIRTLRIYFIIFFVFAMFDYSVRDFEMSASTQDNGSTNNLSWEPGFRAMSRIEVSPTNELEPKLRGFFKLSLLADTKSALQSTNWLEIRYHSLLRQNRFSCASTWETAFLIRSALNSKLRDFHNLYFFA